MSAKPHWEPDVSALERALSKGQAAGASGVEIFAQRGVHREIKVYQQKIESLESSETVGMGVRAFVAGKVGYAYTPLPDQLESIVLKAVENAEVGTPDEFNELPPAQDSEPIAGLYREGIETYSGEGKIDLAMRAEAAACEQDPRVRGYSTSYADDIEDVWIVNTNGLSQSYRAGYAYVYAAVAAEDAGETQSAWWLDAGREPSALDPVAVGVEAARRALSLLGAKKIESCQAAILFEPLVAAQFIGILSHALTGESVQKGRSLFTGKEGEQVASPLVNLIDDGRLPEGFASSPFDGEGVPSGRLALIEDGQLKAFLHNHYSARKAGVSSTGNASRGSFKSLPGVSATNLFVEPGKQSRDELISSMKRGLIVHEVSGIHAGANPVSGDVSLGATGYWVEDGKIVYPVREVTIGGHLLDILKGIEALGDDFQLLPVAGSIGSPSILVSSMTIGGT